MVAMGVPASPMAVAHEVPDVVKAHVAEAELGPEPAEPVGADVRPPRCQAVRLLGEQERIVGQRHADREGALPFLEVEFPQQLSGGIVDGRPAGMVGLGVLLDPQPIDHGDGATDGDLAPSPVDVAPPERARLAPAAAGHSEQPEVDAEVGIELERGSEQVAHLLGGRRLDLGSARGRGRGVHRRVAGDQPPLARLLEGLAHHGVAVAHRPPRQLPAAPTP